MIVIACYNIKGGVGKTTTAINLSYLAAREGARTLVWDLDPQGAASFYFRIKPRLKRAKRLVRGQGDIDDYIKGTDYENLDLLPADFSYRNMDLLLEQQKKATRRLRKILANISKDYDYVFLDCPPSISLVSENIFAAANILLVPTIPTILSLRTLEQLIKFFKNKQISRQAIMPFFSMVDLRKQLHRQITERPPQVLAPFLNTGIHYASVVEQMGTHRAALPEYAGSSRAAQAYDKLWCEIKAAYAEAHS